jgi:hypothetical protein
MAMACGYSHAPVVNGRTRYPLIVETARRIRTKQFILDGEAVLLGASLESVRTNLALFEWPAT